MSLAYDRLHRHRRGYPLEYPLAGVPHPIDRSEPLMSDQSDVRNVIVIGTAPSFTDFTTGCLAEVAVDGAHATGCLVTNAALGGLANHVDVAADGGDIWVAVTGFAPDFSSQFGKLRALDPATGVPAPVASKDSQQIDDVAACGDGYVVAADGTMGASGVRIWKDGVETTTAPLDIGRPTGFGNNLICR